MCTRYAEDFGTHNKDGSDSAGYGVLQFIEKYANDSVKCAIENKRGDEIELIYRNYDWTLTDRALAHIATEIETEPSTQRCI